MYIPKHHRQPDLSATQALIEDYPLGAWVVQASEGLVANHVPFLLDRSRGPHGTLLGHVSRANPVWRQLQDGTPSVVMFQGPQSYITPGWYPGKAAHGEVVPTWNYVVAHAHGVPRAVDDAQWLREFLMRLTATHEAAQAVPWAMTDAPAAFVDKLLRAVVGIEIPIDRLEGKLKASQDEAIPDRLGTVRGLQALGNANASAMASLVQAALAPRAQD